MAGRLISGRRGFTLGRTGAEDNDDRGAPVGTVRVAGFGAGSEDRASANDCAESGLEGPWALLRAAMASLRADRAAALLGVVVFVVVLGLAGSLSSRFRDFGSRLDEILMAVSTAISRTDQSKPTFLPAQATR